MTEELAANMDIEEATIGSPRGWIGPTALIVGVVALVGIALGRGPTSFDPSSPEGAVQEYLVSVSQSRWEDAFAILDPVGFENCEASDLANAGTPEFTAVHNETQAIGSGALVSVMLRFGGSDPLGTGWEQPEQFSLSEIDGFWYITGDPWPYFRWSCDQL